MDEADLAQQRQEALIAAALSARKSNLKSHNGKCIWCLVEPVVHETAFCSADCGDDYFKHQRQIKMRSHHNT